MNNTNSNKDIKNIVSQNIDLPICVEQKISSAYEQIGCDSKPTMKLFNRYRKLAGIAAAVCIIVGLASIGIAANYFVSVNVKEQPKFTEIKFEVDKSKTAHKIKISADYVPKGYTVNDEYNEGIKYSSKDDDLGYSILGYNAVELEAQFNSWESSKNQTIENTTINGIDAIITEEDSIYDGLKRRQIFLIEKNDGYAVQIHHVGNLSIDELKKIASGVKVTMLEETIDYLSEEEKRQLISPHYMNTTIKKENLHEVNTEITHPIKDEINEDVRYTVKDIKIQDSISLSEFPKKHFADFDGEVASYLNEDGTLKPHNIAETDENGDVVNKATVNSKFVIVNMSVKHIKGAFDNDISIAPNMDFYESTNNGEYKIKENSRFATDKKYQIQTDGFPIYFDKATNRTAFNRKKNYYFTIIKPGESLDYTLIYVVDDDQIDNAMLSFYTGRDTFVKVSQ